MSNWTPLPKSSGESFLLLESSTPSNVEFLTQEDTGLIIIEQGQVEFHALPKS